MTQIYVFIVIFTFNAYKDVLTTPSTDTLMRVLTMLGDAVLIGLALIRVHRTSRFYGSKGLLVTLVGSVFTILLSLDRSSLMVQLSAIREPLFFLAALVVVYDILQSEYAERFKKQMTTLLIIFCIAQLPASFLQFLKWGPSDHVGGTLGYNTNVLTLLMFALAFYFIVVFGSSEDSSEFSLWNIALFSLFLLPCTINETKISFIFIPVFFALLTFTSRIYRIVPVAFLGIGLIMLFSMLYSEYVKDTNVLLDERFLERYLVHDKRVDVDIPRGQKLTMTWELMSAEPLTYLFGFGHGSMLSRSLIESSAFSRSVWWMKGAQAFLNTAWFQGGLVLVACLAIPMFRFLGSRHVTSRNMRRFRFFLAFMLFAMWLYHPSLYNRAFAAIVAYLVLWTDEGGIDRQEEIGEEIAAGDEAETDEVHIHPAHARSTQ